MAALAAVAVHRKEHLHMNAQTRRIVAALLFAGLASLCLPGTRAAAVEVPANTAWTKTGVVLKIGAAVRIEASGAVEMSGASDPRPFYHQVPPDGRGELHGAKPQPLMPALALLGKIGENG